MGLLDILQQYGGGAAAPQGNVDDHFDEVSRQVPQEHLGSGLAAAFRSDATPPFPQMIGGLFGQSNPNQQAGLLNQLMQSLGPMAMTGAAGGILGKLLGAGGAAAPTSGTLSGSAATPAITPAQASTLSPADVGTLAAHAEQQDPSIVDRVGSFYAQHPTLVKSLGAVALSAILGHLRSQR